VSCRVFAFAPPFLISSPPLLVRFLVFDASRPPRTKRSQGCLFLLWVFISSLFWPFRVLLLDGAQSIFFFLTWVCRGGKLFFFAVVPLFPQRVSGLRNRSMSRLVVNSGWSFCDVSPIEVLPGNRSYYSSLENNIAPPNQVQLFGPPSTHVSLPEPYCRTTRFPSEPPLPFFWFQRICIIACFPPPPLTPPSLTCVRGPGGSYDFGLLNQTSAPALVFLRIPLSGFPSFIFETP